MTQGTYRRCEQHGCRKKALDDLPFCVHHEALYVRKLMDDNKQMVRLIKAVVTAELWDKGLLD